MRIVNLTGHPIRMGDSRVVLEAEGIIRVETEATEVGDVLFPGPPPVTLPLVQVRHIGVRDMPQPEEDTLYVVSSIVAEFLQRDDVVAPGRVERDSRGYVSACRAFYYPGWRGE